jgi:hypothetical protein
MTSETGIEEEVKPMTFADKWHADRLLKRAKKKAKKSLEAKGISKAEATKLVKGAVNSIANRPMKRSAGRGR